MKHNLEFPRLLSCSHLCPSHLPRARFVFVYMRCAIPSHCLPFHTGTFTYISLPLLSFSLYFFFFFPRALQNKVHTLPLQTHHHLSVRLSAASPPEPQSRRSLAAAAREQMVPGEGRAPASRGLAAGGSRHSSASLTPILPSTVITRRAEQTACAGSLCRTPTKGG